LAADESTESPSEETQGIATEEISVIGVTAEGREEGFREAEPSPLAPRARMIRKPTTRGVEGVRPDMNVTPLVDIVLVLLIIFMVVSPHLDEDIPVTLPGIYQPDPDVETKAPPLVLTIKSAGEYYLGSSAYDLDTVVGKLGEAHALNPLRRLELRADATLKYKEVRALYKRAHQIGFPGVSFLVSHRYRDGHDTAAPATAGAGE